MITLCTIPWWGATPLALCMLGAIACAVYYSVVVFRILRSSRTLPTARDGLDMPTPSGGWPSVAVVVPAHNEADVIARAASTLLRSDYPGDARFIFALDRCTDGTEAALRGAIEDAGERGTRAEVVLIDACPDDWAGKVHAIHAGVTRSTGAPGAELLLFADADTGFDPGCLRATVAILRSRGLSMLSLLSTLTRETWFERHVQPAAGFELVRQYPLDQVNDPRKGRAFANGQFMLFERSAYEAVGGHEGVKDELLEDLAFARRIKKPGSGRTLGCFQADGVLTCQMYRSWPAFTKGWKRIYTEAARRRPERLRQNATRLVLTAALLPGLAAIGGLASVAAALLWSPADPLVAITMSWTLLGVLAYLTAMGMVYSAQHLPSRLVLSYPYGAVRVARIMRIAARDLDTGTATEWGGRSYTREVRT